MQLRNLELRNRVCVRVGCGKDNRLGVVFRPAFTDCVTATGGLSVFVTIMVVVSFVVRVPSEAVNTM